MQTQMFSGSDLRSADLFDSNLRSCNPEEVIPVTTCTNLFVDYNNGYLPQGATKAYLT